MSRMLKFAPLEVMSGTSLELLVYQLAPLLPSLLPLFAAVPLNGSRLGQLYRGCAAQRLSPRSAESRLRRSADSIGSAMRASSHGSRLSHLYRGCALSGSVASAVRASSHGSHLGRR
ncbi:hypothetical protein GCM10028798_20180 [Humibacter antri]